MHSNFAITCSDFLANHSLVNQMCQASERSNENGDEQRCFLAGAEFHVTEHHLSSHVVAELECISQVKTCLAEHI